MKTTILLFLAALIAGCASAPVANSKQTLPLTVQCDRTTFFVMQLPIDQANMPIKEGDWLLYRVAGNLTAGKVLRDRGNNVYRVSGYEGGFVSRDNYVARLIAVPGKK